MSNTIDSLKNVINELNYDLNEKNNIVICNNKNIEKLKNNCDEFYKENYSMKTDFPKQINHLEMLLKRYEENNIELLNKNNY